ncbi:glycine decarboxylase subunit T [Rhodotorula paludigena]|uniref:glycine decarboxylase subunit T n=1 Tax=Rhodotorula paludigena TaxID=86838 RepID=UPI00317A53F1
MLSRAAQRALRPSPSLPARRFASSLGPLKRTALYDFHKQHGAKLVEFAGWEMPLLYEGKDTTRIAGGPVAEHHQVRKSSGLFDVGHMVQSTFKGAGALAFLSYLLPASLATLPVPGEDAHRPFGSTLSVLLNEEGGILDDCMITRWGEESFYLVTNAGRSDVDIPWIKQHVERWNGEHAEKVEFSVLDSSALIALQGPKSHVALQRLLPTDQSLQKLLTFGQSLHLTIPSLSSSSTVHIARGGYTGEDGFEISLPNDHAADFVGMLLEQEEVKLAGLAARDSLRLEAGLCLYGHDLDESVGIGEAGLAWVVGKDRRTPGAFIGSERTLAELKKGGTSRKRVGLVVEKGAPAREGSLIYDPAAPDAGPIGRVTSGLPAPSVGQNISMGYIETAKGFNKKGSQVLVEVRKKMRKAEVVGMPFVKTGYYRGE